MRLKMADVVQSMVVIVGATATGKSALAIELAERLNGEIICADSRTLYRYMDIGTAKPTAQDRAQVPHHGLDLVDPDEPFTVADFKRYAEHKITEITARGKLPIMVGGSGLYIDAVLYDYQFVATGDSMLRAELEGLSVEELQRKIADHGLELPADPHNPRRLMRVIETGGAVGGSADRERGLRPATFVLGLDMPIDILEARIAARVEDMVGQGLIDEVRSVGERYGWEAQALQAPGYRAFHEYLAGSMTLDEAKAAFVKNDRALAKRQKTWFKRNKSIHWLATEDKTTESVALITTFLDT